MHTMQAVHSSALRRTSFLPTRHPDSTNRVSNAGARFQSHSTRPRVVRVFAAKAKPKPKPKISKPTTDAAKDQALQNVLSSIDNQFGKGTIMQLGQANIMRVETFPSGSMTLDLGLGGGYPRGRIVEIYGPESSGKTTLGLHAMAEIQKLGGTSAMIDAEHAFDADYASKLGVDVDKLLVCQPESGEMALEVVDQLVRSSAVDVILVDSVSALVPRSEIEGEIGMVQVGAQARLMSQAMRKLVQNAAKCKCTVIFINQIRYKIGVIYGSPETTSGGNALKYYSSVRIDIRRCGFIKGADGHDVGIRVKTKIVKNKVARPYRIAEMDLMFHKGISSMGCLLDCAEEMNIIQRKGSWYSFGEERLGQGRDKAVLFLEGSPDLASKIELLVRAAGDAEKSGEVVETVDADDKVDDVDGIDEGVDLMYKILEEDADAMEVKL